ncbi:MAG: aminotransferase class I/II-fold pyridoxal phosphate-dependent enzyme [Saprospiraceae bacterium]
MLSLDSNINDKLNLRRAKDSFRSLVDYSALSIDFCSNDYLGFARNLDLKRRIVERLQKGTPMIGATGSRLISGNSDFCEALEVKIAQFHEAAAGLIFNSGYDANLGLLACVSDRNDTIIYDELAHASIRDGIRLSRSKAFSFRHNNLVDLEKKLRYAKEGERIIVVESIYSMDGDQAPLLEIHQLAQKYGAALIVDEAHATGVVGPQGKGLVVELGLAQEVFARIHTFGKALGCHGAIILGNDNLRDYLINYARSFIYTTALPWDSLIAIEEAYQLLEHTPAKQQIIRLQSHFEKVVSPTILANLIPSESPIKSLLIPGNQAAKKLAQSFAKQGVAIKAILAPTVPAGQERLRICLHSFNTLEEINTLAEILNQELC